MHSRARASGASAAYFDRPARQATEPRAKREAMSALCHGLVVDSMFERRHQSTSSYSWPAVRGVVFICACAVLTGTRLYNGMLLVASVQSHYPMIVTSNILV